MLSKGRFKNFFAMSIHGQRLRVQAQAALAAWPQGWGWAERGSSKVSSSTICRRAPPSAPERRDPRGSSGAQPAMLGAAGTKISAPPEPGQLGHHNIIKILTVRVSREGSGDGGGPGEELLEVLGMFCCIPVPGKERRKEGRCGAASSQLWFLRFLGFSFR